MQTRKVLFPTSALTLRWTCT